MKKTLYALLFTALPFCSSAQNLIYSSNFNGNANDASGNALHGMVSGATLTTGQTGVPNSAYYFDGVDDYIEIPASPLTNLTKWTLHARIQPQGFYPGVCQGNFIINHGVDYDDDHYHMEFMDNLYDNDCNTQTDSQSKIIVSPAGYHSGLPWLNGPSVNLNTWYCIIARYDGDTVRMSVNTTEVAAFAWTNQYTSAPANGRPTYLGFSGWLPNFPYWFKGKMDKIAIWDDAISDSLVGALCLNLNEDTTGNPEDSTLVVNNYTVEDISVTIGPNPAKDRLNIILPAYVDNAELTITNALGQVVAAQHARTQYSTVDLSRLPAGIYLLNTSIDGRRSVQKFIKQ